MAGYERTIKIAFDRISEEILEAEQVFDSKKKAFLVRKQFHRDEVELYCCECEQKLNVSTSKFDRLHFKHEPGHKPCILTDGSMTPKEVDEFNRIFLAKESDRHKTLKHLIAEKLLNTPGVDISSIAVDNKMIIADSGRRRPDVLCRYMDKSFAFEIQLSNLSLRYILNRYEFYRQNGIYLVWILDNFNVHEQSQMVRDIKYLNRYENFFKLDESQDTLHLHCQYKVPYITPNHEVHTKWQEKSVSFPELSFNTETYELFYFDLLGEKTKREEESLKLIEQWEQTQQALRADIKYKEAAAKSKQIIGVIAHYRKQRWSSFEQAKEMIAELNDYEIDVFNEIMD